MATWTTPGANFPTAWIYGAAVCSGLKRTKHLKDSIILTQMLNISRFLQKLVNGWQERAFAQQD